MFSYLQKYLVFFRVDTQLQPGMICQDSELLLIIYSAKNILFHAANIDFLYSFCFTGNYKTSSFIEYLNIGMNIAIWRLVGKNWTGEDFSKSRSHENNSYHIL